MGVWLGFAVLMAMYGAYRIDTALAGCEAAGAWFDADAAAWWGGTGPG